MATDNRPMGNSFIVGGLVLYSIAPAVTGNGLPTGKEYVRKESLVSNPCQLSWGMNKGPYSETCSRKATDFLLEKSSFTSHVIA